MEVGKSGYIFILNEILPVNYIVVLIGNANLLVLKPMNFYIRRICFLTKQKYIHVHREVDDRHPRFPATGEGRALFVISAFSLK